MYDVQFKMFGCMIAIVVYLTRSSSALAQLYGTKATLEHHHFNHAIMILNSEVSSFFPINKGLSNHIRIHI